MLTIGIKNLIGKRTVKVSPLSGGDFILTAARNVICTATGKKIKLTTSNQSN